MVKKEIDKIIQDNKHQHSDKLLKIKHDLQDVIDERELTKQMYFWSPGCGAGERRWNESCRNISITVKMSGLTVDYSRSYSESCHYVYASDHIYLRCGDDVRKGTVSDLKKIMEGIEGILVTRGKAA